MLNLMPFGTGRVVLQAIHADTIAMIADAIAIMRLANPISNPPVASILWAAFYATSGVVSRKYLWSGVRFQKTEVFETPQVHSKEGICLHPQSSANTIGSLYQKQPPAAIESSQEGRHCAETAGC